MKLNHVLILRYLLLSMFFFTIVSEPIAQKRHTSFEGPGSQLLHHFFEYGSQSYHVTISILDSINVYRFNSDASRDLIRCDYIEQSSKRNYHFDQNKYIFREDGILEYNFITGDTTLFRLPEGLKISRSQSYWSPLSQIKQVRVVDEITNEDFHIGFEIEHGFVTQPFEYNSIQFVGNYRVRTTYFEDANVYTLTSMIDGSLDSIITDRKNYNTLFFRNDEIHYIYDSGVYKYQHQELDIKLVEMQAVGFDDEKSVLNDINSIYVFQREGENLEISKYSKGNFQIEFYKSLWVPSLRSLANMTTFDKFLYISSPFNIHVFNTEKDTYITRQSHSNTIPLPINEKGDIINYRNRRWAELEVEIINVENSVVEELIFSESLQNRASNKFMKIGNRIVHPYYTVDSSTKEIYSNALDLTFEGYGYNGVSINQINNSLILLGDEAVIINDSTSVVIDTTTKLNIADSVEGNSAFYSSKSDDLYTWDGNNLNFQGQAEEFNLNTSKKYTLLSDCLIYNAWNQLVFHTLPSDTIIVSAEFDDILYDLGVFNDYAYYSFGKEMLRVNCDGIFESIYSSQNEIFDPSHRSFFYRSEDLALLGTEDGVLAINSDNTVEHIDTIDFQFTRGYQIRDGSHVLHSNNANGKCIIYNNGDFIIENLGILHEWNTIYLGEQTYWLKELDTMYCAIKNEYFNLVDLPEDFNVVKVFKKNNERYLAAYKNKSGVVLNIYKWESANNTLNLVNEILFEYDEFFEEFYSVDTSCIVMTTKRILILDDMFVISELKDIKPHNHDSKLTIFNGNAYFLAVDPKYGNQLFELDFNQRINLQDDIINKLSQQVTLFPNPAYSYVTIQEKFVMNHDFTIFNTMGQVCSFGSVSKQIDISKLPNGQYYILITEKDQRYLGEFIKL